MPVLVDGNNLVHAARACEPGGGAIGRSILCRRLGDWARRTGHRIQVVFDGPAPTADVMAQIGDPDVNMIFSGAGVTADSVLENILEEDSAARRLLVVSTDRAVAKVARRRRARSIRSDEFWLAMKADLDRPMPARTEPREKRHGLQAESVDDWLKLFGFDQK